MSLNPFDDDDGGFGTSSKKNGGFSGGRGSAGRRASPQDYSRPSAGAAANPPPYGGYHDDYYGGGSDQPPALDYDARILAANRKMEESSANSLRVLNETMRMGIDTTEELDRQAEALDRTEQRLDEMSMDLDQGQRNLRKIKSPFGGFRNMFSRRPNAQEITDPKGFKPTQGGAKKNSGKSAKDPGNQKKSKQEQLPPQSVGNATVDRNLDEMEKALGQLKGIGLVMGEQIDDSNEQLERLKYKLERNDIKVNKLNKDIKKEL